MLCLVSFRGVVYSGATNLWKYIQLFCSNFSISNWICLFLLSFLPKGSWFMEFAPICVYLVLNLLLFLIPIGVSFLYASFSRLAYPEKLSAYECGFDPLDNARSNIQFSLLVFILCIIWHCFIIWVCKFCLAWIVWFSSCTLGFGCREYSGQVRMMLSCLRLWCAIQGLGMYGATGNDILDVNIMKCGWGSILKLAFGLNVTAAAWP